MRSRLSSVTTPAAEGEPPPEQGEVAAPHRQAAGHRRRGRRARDLELARHLGVEAATAHEHRLRCADRQGETNRRRSRRRCGARRWLGRRGPHDGRRRRCGAALLVDLAHFQRRKGGRLLRPDRDLGPVDGDRPRDAEAAQRRSRHLDVAGDAGDQIRPADQQGVAAGDGEIGHQPLLRVEPHRAGYADAAAARGLEVEPLHLKGVALQDQPPLAAAQPQPRLGQGHGAVGEVDAAVAGHARTRDLDRQVRTQPAGDVADVVAQQRRKRRQVHRAADGGRAGERCRTARQRRLALQRQVRRRRGQPRIDAGLPSHQRARSLHVERRHQGRFGPAQAQASDVVGAVDHRRVHAALDAQLGLQGAVEIGAGREGVDQRQRHARQLELQIAARWSERAADRQSSAADAQIGRLDGHARSGDVNARRAGERDGDRPIAPVEARQTDHEIVAQQLDLRRGIGSGLRARGLQRDDEASAGRRSPWRSVY